MMVVSSERFTKQLHQYRSQPGLNPFQEASNLSCEKYILYILLLEIPFGMKTKILYLNALVFREISFQEARQNIPVCMFLIIWFNFFQRLRWRWRSCNGVALAVFCCSAVAIAIGSGVYGCTGQLIS
jgi:hypothetical protein